MSEIADMLIADKLQSIKATKQAIRGAIVDKGVDVPEGTTFAEYANKVSEIETVSSPIYEEYDIGVTNRSNNIVGSCYRLGNIGHVSISGGNIYGLIESNLSDANIAAANTPDWLGNYFQNHGCMTCGFILSDSPPEIYAQPISVMYDLFSSNIVFTSLSNVSSGFFLIQIDVPIISDGDTGIII